MSHEEAAVSHWSGTMFVAGLGVGIAIGVALGSVVALRLGSRDAGFLYHAGMTARAAGDTADARRYLGAALAGNPRFSPLYAPRARRALEALA